MSTATSTCFAPSSDSFSAAVELPSFSSPRLPPVNCLHGDTIVVHTRSGWPATLRDVVGRRDASVLVMHEASVLRAQRASAYLAHEPRALYRLVTYTGRSIDVTPSFPFLTPSGWKPLAELTATDAVAVVADYPELFGRNDTDGELVKLLAYLMSSGAWPDGSVAMFADPSVQADFEGAVGAKGDVCECKLAHDGTARAHARSAVGGRGKVVGYLELVGVAGLAPEDRVVPDFVFGLQREKLRLFLNRIFTCDGQLESSGRITLQTKSIRVSRQLQHLLARFGIVSILRGIEADGGRLEAVELAIASKADVVRFIDEIGFFGEKAARAEAVRHALYHVRVDDPNLRRLGPILFDRIIAIEPLEVAPVFALVLDCHNNFIANDFVVRASSFAAWGDELVADQAG